MRILTASFCLILFFSSKANDGSFYASGNTLIPLNETVVQLKKEVLNLTRKKEWMQVNIYFEFFNPGDEKELLVGFVTPPAVGDVSEEEEAHPQIKEFTVMVNGSVLKYNITRLEKSGFKLKSAFGDGQDYVYHFKMKFKKGTTIIQHSYLYRGGSSVETIYDFYYRLTTGATWANKQIDDFELNINMGDDVFFSTPSTFDKQPATWMISGIGRVSRSSNFKFLAYGENDYADMRMIYIRKGSLHFKTKNFKPTLDLGLAIYPLHRELNFWCEQGIENEFIALNEFYNPDTARANIRNFTDKELKLYKNLNYARMGYDFKDPYLKQSFAKYIWYLPDPNIIIDKTPEYYYNKDILLILEAEEKRRKEKTTM